MNYQILDALNDMSGGTVVDAVMVFCAMYLIYVVFAVLAFAAWPALRRRDWPPLFGVAASLLLAFLLGVLASHLYAEQRPFTTHHDIHLLVSHAAGQSFPSDHATAAFAVAFAVLVFLSRRWGALLLVLAVVIGFARVFDGLHYPGDVLGSIVVAACGVGLVALGARVLTASPGTSQAD
jgi:undecaprenyl-diphosphatase